MCRWDITDKNIMRKILLSLLCFFFCSIMAFAGEKKLPNGEIAFWDDNSPVIEYKSLAVEVKLTGKCDFNVWGSVTVGDQTKNLFIPAGKLRAVVYFENLENGRRYYPVVEIKN